MVLSHFAITSSVHSWFYVQYSQLQAHGSVICILINCIYNVYRALLQVRVMVGSLEKNTRNCGIALAYNQPQMQFFNYFAETRICYATGKKYRSHIFRTKWFHLMQDAKEARGYGAEVDNCINRQ